MDCLDDVIEGCKNGDKTMQKALYDRYSPQYYALCRRYAGNDETAQEILTEGFLDIFSNINNYRGTGSLEAWMRVIFLRQAIRVFRRDHKHRQMLTDDLQLTAARISLPIEQQIDIREAITLAMRQLNDLQRQSFNLVAVEGYSFAEAADLLQMPQHNVKYAYSSARKSLRYLLRTHLGKHYLKQ